MSYSRIILISWLNSAMYYLQIFLTIQNGFLDTQSLEDKSKTKDEFLSDKEAFLSTISRQSSCRQQLDKLTNDGSTSGGPHPENFWIWRP